MHATSSKTFFRFSVVAVLATLISACSGTSNQSAASAKASSAQRKDCDFSHAKVSGVFCHKSIFALIASPEKYYGKKIFTYGYLRKNPNGTFSLAVTPESPKVVDFASCLLVKPGNSDAYSEVVEGKVYSASVSGEIQHSHTNVCAGEIVRAKIINWAIEN